MKILQATNLYYSKYKYKFTLRRREYSRVSPPRILGYSIIDFRDYVKKMGKDSRSLQNYNRISIFTNDFEEAKTLYNMGKSDQFRIAELAIYAFDNEPVDKDEHPYILEYSKIKFFSKYQYAVKLQKIGPITERTAIMEQYGANISDKKSNSAIIVNDILFTQYSPWNQSFHIYCNDEYMVMALKVMYGANAICRKRIIVP